MVQNIKIPETKVLTYQLNTLSNYYELHTQPPGFNRLPKELKVEDTQNPAMKERAKQLIRGRQNNGKYLFFTGLRDTKTTRFYFGDDGYTRPQKKSFVLFHFNNDCTRLTVYYFSGFMPLKPMREQFIQTFIETL